MKYKDREYYAKNASSFYYNRHKDRIDKCPYSQDYKIHQQLLSCSENAHPDAIDAITEHPQYTWSKCEQCETWVDAIVRIGEDTGDAYEDRTLDVCKNCLTKALALFN